MKSNSALDELLETEINTGFDKINSFLFAKQPLSALDEINKITHRIKSYLKNNQCIQFDYTNIFLHYAVIYEQLKDRENTILYLSKCIESVGKLLSVFSQNIDGDTKSELIKVLADIYKRLAICQESNDIEPQIAAISWLKAAKAFDAYSSIINATSSSLRAVRWFITAKDSTSAIRTLSWSLTLIERLKHSPTQGLFYNEMGIAFMAFELMDDGIRCFEMAKKRLSKRGSLILASISQNLGSAYTMSREFQKAIKTLQESVNYYRAVRNRAGQAQSNCNLGYALACYGELRKARWHYTLGREAAKDAEWPAVQLQAEQALEALEYVEDGEALTLFNVNPTYALCPSVAASQAEEVSHSETLQMRLLKTKFVKPKPSAVTNRRKRLHIIPPPSSPIMKSDTLSPFPSSNLFCSSKLPTTARSCLTSFKLIRKQGEPESSTRAPESPFEKTSQSWQTVVSSASSSGSKLTARQLIPNSLEAEKNHSRLLMQLSKNSRNWTIIQQKINADIGKMTKTGSTQTEIESQSALNRSKTSEASMSQQSNLNDSIAETSMSQQSSLIDSMGEYAIRLSPLNTSLSSSIDIAPLPTQKLLDRREMETGDVQKIQIETMENGLQNNFVRDIDHHYFPQKLGQLDSIFDQSTNSHLGISSLGGDTSIAAMGDLNYQYKNESTTETHSVDLECHKKSFLDASIQKNFKHKIYKSAYSSRIAHRRSMCVSLKPIRQSRKLRKRAKHKPKLMSHSDCWDEGIAQQKRVDVNSEITVIAKQISKFETWSRAFSEISSLLDENNDDTIRISSVKPWNTNPPINACTVNVRVSSDSDSQLSTTLGGLSLGDGPGSQKGNNHETSEFEQVSYCDGTNSKRLKVNLSKCKLM